MGKFGLSEGMILAAADEENKTVVLASLDSDSAEPGWQVR
jgi:hypothetical protein